MINNNKFDLKINKRNLDILMATTAEKMTAASERIDQKKDKIRAKTPFFKRLSDKISDFDNKMTAKHGAVYVKIRESIKNTARTIAAYKIFGVPGLVAMCAYKTGEKVYSLLKPAYEAKKRGEVKSILDYFKHNKKESCFTLTSASLSIASAGATVAGAPAAVDAIRVGKASLLAYPEFKNVLKSFNRWAFGKGEFKDVRQNAAVLGITVATYFAGPNGVPMTRGSTAPLKDGRKPHSQALTDEKKAAINSLILSLRQNAK